MVTTRYSVRGTHGGRLLGVPGTGRPLAFDGILRSRFSAGRLVEEWNDYDVKAIRGELEGGLRRSEAPGPRPSRGRLPVSAQGVSPALLRPLVVLHHIPKTAGTSLKGVLGGDARAFCLLRDPVERVISRYHFMLGQLNEARQTAAYPARRLITRFARPIEEVEWALDDIYQHLGDGSEKASPLHHAFKGFFNGQARALLEPHYDTSKFAYSGDAGPDLGEWGELARHILERHYVAGVQERFAESVARFAQAFGWKHQPHPRERVNSLRPRADAVSKGTRELILAYNRVDAELHASCAATFSSYSYSA